MQLLPSANFVAFLQHITFNPYIRGQYTIVLSQGLIERPETRNFSQDLFKINWIGFYSLWSMAQYEFYNRLSAWIKSSKSLSLWITNWKVTIFKKTRIFSTHLVKLERHLKPPLIHIFTVDQEKKISTLPKKVIMKKVPSMEKVSSELPRGTEELNLPCLLNE